MASVYDCGFPGGGFKACLYAMRGIGDYWIVNLEEGLFEIRRDPRPDPAMAFGFGYASLAILYDDDVVSPLAAPDIRLAVSELLA